MLRRLRLLTAGESHGPHLSVILDGLPAGLPLQLEQLNFQLARRQKGFGSGGRMRIEKDRVRLSAGFVAGKTSGGPLAIEIPNLDFANWQEREIEAMTIPRPGHADLTGAIKYQHADLRLCLERASARETAGRVAAGAVCRQLLEHFGVRIGGFVERIASVAVPIPEVPDAAELEALAARALQDDLGCPDPQASAALRAEIKQVMAAKDTAGGVFRIFALHLPPGLGSYVQWDRRLDARLAFAMLSIPAMKGIEIGPAFANAGRRGSAVHDEIFPADSGRLRRHSNRAGGLEGGISTGEPLLLSVAMKPISTTLAPRRSVDLKSGEAAVTRYERSDFCALPRAVPIGEAMLALVLADALLEKLGGDSMREIEPRFKALAGNRLDDLDLDGKSWRFDYAI